MKTVVYSDDGEIIRIQLIDKSGEIEKSTTVCLNEKEASILAKQLDEELTNVRNVAAYRTKRKKEAKAWQEETNSERQQLAKKVEQRRSRQ